MTRYRTAFTVAISLLVTIQITGQDRTGSLSSMSEQLRARYDIVALQPGVALLPRQAGSGVRLIQVVDGVVSVDGHALTERQLRERLGPDADMILRIRGLDQQQQRNLAEPAVAASATPAPQTAASPERLSRGDVVRFGSSITISSDERVQGDVVAIGGSADVNGEVTGDVVAIGGSVRLGPEAVVRGDVTAVGGTLTRAPGARIFGTIDEVGVGRRGIRHDWVPTEVFGSFWSRVGGLTATTLRLTVLVLFGLLIVALGRTPIERISACTTTSPLRSGLIGLLAEVMFLPLLTLLVVVLVVSIIGIPLLALVPFAMLLVMLVMLVGFVGLAYSAGQWMTTRFRWTERGALATVAIGVIAIGIPTLVAKLASVAGTGMLSIPLTALGYLVEYVAWTIGFGAALLAWYEWQTRLGPQTPVASTPPSAPSP